MKRFGLLSALFIMLSAIGFTSCDSEPVDSELVGSNDNEGANAPAGPAVFKADFSNQTFTATETKAFKTEALISIQGMRGTNGEMFTLVIDGATTGTYNNALLSYEPNNLSEYTYLNLNPDLSNNAENGTVVITTINTSNKTISGTFSFTGYWSNEGAMLPPILFTNGTFNNIPYTDGPTPGTEITEYFKASVNGQAFDYSNNIVTAIAGEPVATISINGITSDSNRIHLFIKDNLGVGSHPITGGLMDDVRAEVVNSAGEFDATTGTLVITAKENNTITGTFQFTAGDIQVTNGTFKVRYDDTE